MLDALRVIWSIGVRDKEICSKKIGQNIKYDYIVMKNYGVELKGDFFDTMVAHYLLQPDGHHNMDYLAEIGLL